jgi:adenosylhomocysteinase
MKKLNLKKLAPLGEKKIKWAGQRMPVLSLIAQEFFQTKPFKNLKIGACLHVTTETANLILTLKNGGAKVYLAASNPLSTQDEVVAALTLNHQIPVFAYHGEDEKFYHQALLKILSLKPDLLIDDGADLISLAVQTKNYRQVLGASEETTTGVVRIKNLEKNNQLPFPTFAVNDARVKNLFDNRYGTGQSTIDGIIRATNTLLAGKNFVVLGYGWCGKGLAQRAKGLGSNVFVTEIDPVKALEARMDGFKVLPATEAASVGDIFVTVTGNLDVLTAKHFLKMKDGAIFANSGHFNVEINLKDLNKVAKQKRLIRDNLEEYTLKNKRRIYLLAEGRLVNLAAAEGHPSEVMDLSFATQALSQEYLVKNAAKLDKKVYFLPKKLEEKIALLKLKSMGIKIDNLSPKQKQYMSSWDLGTLEN